LYNLVDLLLVRCCYRWLCSFLARRRRSFSWILRSSRGGLVNCLV